jgi:hypothetical protein
MTQRSPYSAATVMKASRPQAQLRARSGLCSIAGTSERASSTNVDYGGRGVERSKNEEAFSALGCGSAGFIDRRGNGARPVSEQSTEVAGNIWTEQRKPK